MGGKQRLFTPTSMKRFYLAVPAEYEEKAIRKIGELGAVQLTREVPREGEEKSEAVEACRKFMRLYERMNTILAKVEMERRIEARVAQETAEASVEQIKSFVDQIESQLDETIRAIEKTEAEIKSFKAMEERLGFLKTYGLRVDEIGDFRHIFVKAGFLSNALLPKLGAYLGGTSVVYTSKPGRPRESFVVVTGLNEDKSLVDSTLKLLNFDEVIFSQTLSPEPKQALEEVKNNIGLKEKEIRSLKEDLSQIKGKFSFFEPFVSNTLLIEEAKGSVARTKKKSLIHGWIPADKVELFKAQVEEAVQKESIYLKFENPHPEDKVPVRTKSRGLLGSFEIFTRLQGVPNYFEVDPTPIYMILYVIMFGMMFGDMGLGSIFIVLGVLLTRMKKGLLVFSSSATRKLGQIVLSCGISAVIFGLFYGEAFLLEIIQPILLSPLHEIEEIIVIALVFGVSQISLALVLNTINKIRRKETLKAIFSGHGVAGITYYSAGVVLAIAFIRENGFSAFLQQSIISFTVIALISLAIIFLSPVIETLLERKKAKLTEKLIEGFGEGLETFIAFIANSVSYIRLAAFAIAHGALGLAAVIFASTIGNVPSYIIMNILVFLIEGFAAFIQSLRLMYYEFSTKFYAGDGVGYKPFKIRGPKTKV